MKTGTKHQSAKTRKQQILSAADLVLMEVGMSQFTIDQVIERAQIAKGTVYKYYRSKDEILAELSVRAITLLLAMFEESSSKCTNSVDKLVSNCHASYEYGEEYPEYYKLLSFMERPEFDIDIQEYVNISHRIQVFVNGIIHEGQAKGEIKPHLNATLIQHVLWASCMGVVQFIDTKKKLIRNVHELHLKDVIDVFSEMITTGMRAE